MSFKEKVFQRLMLANADATTWNIEEAVKENPENLVPAVYYSQGCSVYFMLTYVLEILVEKGVIADTPEARAAYLSAIRPLNETSIGKRETAYLEERYPEIVSQAEEAVRRDEEEEKLGGDFISSLKKIFGDDAVVITVKEEMA